jgi:hypothetical protein
MPIDLVKLDAGNEEGAPALGKHGLPQTLKPSLGRRATIAQHAE